MNRVWKGLLGVTTATAATVALLPGAAIAAAPGWWSAEGYTVTNSGFNPNEPTLTMAKVPSLKLLRTTSPDRKGLSAPVLDKGRVFAYDTGGITAYDEATGAQVWRHDLTSGSVSGKLVVTGGKVVVLYNFGSPPYGGTAVLILDAATGAVQATANNNNGYMDQLLVDRGVIVVSGDARWDSKTFGYSLSDGKELWRNHLYMYQPVSANGRILVEGSDGSAQYGRIVDILTGTVLFSDLWKPYNVLAASSDGKKFWVAWGHSLQVLDATTGKLSWIASYVHPKFAVLSPSRLYVATNDNRVIAFNLSNNSVAWTKTYSKPLLRPIIAGGALYVPVAGDRMYVVNPANGAALTSPAFTGTAYPPVVTGAKVYVTNGVKMSVYGL